MPIILKNIDSEWKGKKAGNGSEKDKKQWRLFHNGLHHYF